MARPREFDRQTALERAMLVFWRKGFTAASMQDLCEGMGIGSPSLYVAFGSKEALYCEAIDYYSDTLGPHVWGKLTNGRSAKLDIKAMLMAASTLLCTSELSPGGCLVMQGAMGDEYPPNAAAAVRRARLKSLQMIQDRLKSAVEMGELPKSTKVAHWSRFYLAVFQGMAMQARDGAAAADLRGVVNAAMAAWPGTKP
jgi:AcrR family transcriptional regulator